MRKLLLILAFMCFIHCIGKPLISGYYGDNLLILNKKGHIYGQYEYYEKWNNDINNFENVCKFYFYAPQLSDACDTIKIKIGLPGVGINDGIIVKKNNFICIYSDYICGYSTVDFQKEGLCSSLRKSEDGDALGIIKSAKAHFYNQPVDSAKAKSYIVKNDFVRIIRQNESWSQVEYVSIFSGKKMIKWIRSDELYPYDPIKWKHE